jgi:hypothetical protein
MEEQTLTENEVRRLVRRINNGVNVEFPETGYCLTPEQEQKGLEWLVKHKDEMGYRETEAVDNLSEIRFVGTVPGQYNNHQYPSYRVIGRSGVKFDYKVEAGRLYIVG